MEKLHYFSKIVPLPELKYVNNNQPAGTMTILVTYSTKRFCVTTDDAETDISLSSWSVCNNLSEKLGAKQSYLANI